jgi:hypothetical protein
MAQINGRLTICDRCGEQVFSKYTGEGVTDGGYTRWDKFENLPDGWESHYDGIGMLCPKCNEEYKKLIENFNKSVDK